MPMQGPTTDHAEILRWARSHNARPAELHPFVFDSQPAILRFIFGDVPENASNIQLISWENFFAKFDVMGLALVYESDAGGDGSRHHELLQIESESPYKFNGYPA